MNQNKKVGRPKKAPQKKKNAHIFVNLTQEQKAALVKLSEIKDASLSKLCIEALQKAKFI